MSARPATKPTGAGRPPFNGEAMKSRTLRMTDAEWDKCLALGGATWVRRKVNAAPDPRQPRKHVAVKV